MHWNIFYYDTVNVIPFGKGYLEVIRLYSEVVLHTLALSITHQTYHLKNQFSACVRL